MKFNINDRVEHEIYGKGTIVEIDIDSYLVQFDTPNIHLHNGNNSRNRYQDNTCYYFNGSQLKLLNEKDMIKPISRIETTPLEITFGFDTSKPKATVPLPERYIINKNATILFWENGEKTVVKRCADDEFNPRLAFLTAFFQHYVDMSKNKANKYLANLQVEVKKEEPKQKPKHMKEKMKFKIGDKAIVIETGTIVKIIGIDSSRTLLPYLGKYNDGHSVWFGKNELKPIKEGK